MKNRRDLMTIITRGNIVLGMLANAIKIRKKSKRHQSCKVRENYHYMQMMAQVPNQGESSEKQVKLIRDFKRWFQDNV